MHFVAITLSAFLAAVHGISHIDHVVFQNNKECNNATESHGHNKIGNAVVGFKIETYVAATKMLVYIKANVEKDENDDLCRREFLRTVMDLNKLIEGAYGNFLIRGFMESFIDQIEALNVTMPLMPVSL